MKDIEDLIRAEVANGKYFVIYQMLGQFGDRIPKDVQEEMAKEAIKEGELSDRIKAKVKIRL